MARVTGKGIRFGGRKKGTPNAITLDLIKALAENNLDPLRIVQEAIASGELTAKERLAAGLSLMDFVYPKRSPVNAIGQSDIDGELVVRVKWGDEDELNAGNASPDAATKKN